MPPGVPDNDYGEFPILPFFSDVTSDPNPQFISTLTWKSIENSYWCKEVMRQLSEDKIEMFPWSIVFVRSVTLRFLTSLPRI